MNLICNAFVCVHVCVRQGDKLRTRRHNRGHRGITILTVFKLVLVGPSLEKKKSACNPDIVDYEQ